MLIRQLPFGTLLLSGLNALDATDRHLLLSREGEDANLVRYASLLVQVCRDCALASTSSRAASIGARNILGPVLKDAARAHQPPFSLRLFLLWREEASDAVPPPPQLSLSAALWEWV